VCFGAVTFRLPLAIVAVAATSSAQEIEDPSGSLATFHAALARTAAREPGAVTRVAHFGDSLMVADGPTGALRRRFQARFGDAGHGFVLLGEPWVFYRHRNVRSGSTGRWKQYRVTHPRDPVGLYGLGGVSFRSGRRGASAWVSTDPDGPVGQAVSRFVVSYLRRPGAGSFEIVVDDLFVRRVPTAADVPESAFHTVILPDGAHRLEIRAAGDGEVRLFGVVLERDGPGVVWDSLAVTGARAAAFLDADEPHFRGQLERRRPDLVVVGLGTNESSSPNIPADQVEARTGELLARMKAVVPACLVLSPPDRVGTRAGGTTTPDSLLRVVGAQRRAAHGAGCAFFDTFRAMGGRGAMQRWWLRGLAAPDRRHLSEEGNEAMAQLVENAILAGFDAATLRPHE